MQAYVIGLFALSVCCAMVELFSPEGEGGGIAQHIKWLIGICLLCVLWVPLSALLQGGGNNLPGRISDAVEQWLSGGEEAQEQYDQLWQDQQQKLDLAYAGETIRQLLCEQFERSPGEISVQVQTDEQGERLTHLRVGLSGGAIWINTHQLQEFIQKTFGCESTVYLE